MVDVPESMKSELMEWNAGRGISLMDWTAASGSFSLAVGYSELFWPSFVEFEGYVLREDFNLQSLRGFEQATNSNRQSVERVMNHFHISDIHACSQDVAIDKLILLGRQLQRTYTAKLAFEFPRRQFAVEFFQPEDENDLEDYQISFFQSGTAGGWWRRTKHLFK